jgi:hypothetical protein
MRRLVTITASVAILSAGWLVCNRAEAGSSTSAPTKYRNATQATAVPPVRHVGRGTLGITEFSSSSAINHPPKR